MTAVEQRLMLKGMWPFSRRPAEGRSAIPLYAETSYHERLNQLETRIERLELDNTERQIAVMTMAEKVLHQLRARESRRVEREAQEEPLQDAPGEAISPEPSPGYPPSTAHLARRFRSAGG